jgi:hypothetical protein
VAEPRASFVRGAGDIVGANRSIRAGGMVHTDVANVANFACYGSPRARERVVALLASAALIAASAPPLALLFNALTAIPAAAAGGTGGNGSGCGGASPSYS